MNSTIYPCHICKSKCDDKCDKRTQWLNDYIKIVVKNNKPCQADICRNCKQLGGKRT